MAYRPANRRMNIIRTLCVKWMREQFPKTYMSIVRQAEQLIPRGKSGDPAMKGKRKKGERMR